MRNNNLLGKEKEVYGYNDFGQDLYSNQGVEQPFGYTGYEKDYITNTFFGQAREYCPKTGRFISKDRGKYFNTTMPNSWNLYNYCWQNPIKYIDRTGFVLEDDYPLQPIENSQVQMTVTGNTIDIDVYVDFKGDDTLTTSNGTSCKDLAILGIEDWAGSYGNVYGETVTVNVNTHEGNSSIFNSQDYVKIYLESGNGIPNTSYGLFGWSNTSNKKIKMYREDERNSGPYSDDAYQWTVAHEMGHVFGLDDAYPADANWFQNFFGITVRPDASSIVGANDIMRYQFNGINISSYDIEMLILAYYTGEFQSYFDYLGHTKSDCLP